MKDYDKIIASLRKELQNEKKKVSALEQEVALLNEENRRLKMRKKTRVL